MKHLGKKLSALLVTAAMAATMASTAGAAEGSNYEPIPANNATFTKYLIVDGDATAPSVTFSYTISSEEVAAITPGTSETLPVYKGTGAPTIADVSFSKDDTKETSTLITEYNTYKKTITINMAGVTFSEPGVYRYYIKEVVPEGDSAIGGMYYDVDYSAAANLPANGDLYRTLDVYVEDTGDSAKTLKVTEYIMYDGKIETAPPSGTPTGTNSPIEGTKVIAVNTANGAEVDGATKTDNYANYYTSQSLTFGKVVTGNQGSRDKYFKLTLSLTSPVASTIAVDVSNADGSLPSATDLNKATNANYAGATNPTSITLTAGTAVETVFYLQHGQYIIVNGIPVGTAYALTEDSEGYTSTQGITEEVSVINWDNEEGNDALPDNVSGTIAVNTDVHTGYTNDKQGVIPTGVLLTMAPVIVVGVVVIAGLAFFAVRSAKRKAVEAAEAEADSEE